jgi:hypothetical protein
MDTMRHDLERTQSYEETMLRTSSQGVCTTYSNASIQARGVRCTYCKIWRRNATSQTKNQQWSRLGKAHRYMMLHVHVFHLDNSSHLNALFNYKRNYTFSSIPTSSTPPHPICLHTFAQSLTTHQLHRNCCPCVYSDQSNPKKR